MSRAADRPRRAAMRLSRLQVYAGERCLLKDAEAVIPRGKITLIVGPSGAGKSILLRILGGLLPQHGEAIRWEGQIDSGGEAAARQPGVVFQQFALFDELSPTANVQFAIDHRQQRRDAPELSAAQWLEELGVPSNVRVASLSGGQKQRLAVARTLAFEPEIVLYDEPTSGLDAVAGRRVAELIQQTQQRHGKTCVVVTHDYQTLLRIADQVIVFDAANQALRTLTAAELADFSAQLEAASGSPVAAERPQPVSVVAQLAGRMTTAMEVTGRAVGLLVRLPLDLLPLWPRPRWALRSGLHYLRLVCGPSAIFYLIAAGIIVGFVTTYFTFRYLPFALYTKPLVIEDLLTAIGFALFRIFVPVLATILIAARCGAAVAADCGVKKYGGQTDALKTFGVRPQAYLLCPIVIAFAVATPILTWVAYQAARAASVVSFGASHPELGYHFWDLYFHAEIYQPGTWLAKGFEWWLAKTVLCGVGTGVIAYHQALADKGSAEDVSRSITATVLWATLWVLTVHFVAAFFEF